MIPYFGQEKKDKWREYPLHLDLCWVSFSYLLNLFSIVFAVKQDNSLNLRKKPKASYLKITFLSSVVVIAEIVFESHGYC